MTGTTGRASNTNAGNIEQNLCTANGSSQSSIIYPPQSPTRITNSSILKLAGAFHCVKTSRIRFWAFSYSIGEPCGRSDQVSMYFIGAPWEKKGDVHGCPAFFLFLPLRYFLSGLVRAITTSYPPPPS